MTVTLPVDTADLVPPDARQRLLQALERAGLTAPPKDLDLTENALRVLQARYFLRNKDGQVVEDAQGMFRRVARAIAQVERQYDPHADVGAIADAFYGMMARLEFLPNSPTLMNAGTGAGTLSACFVIGLEDTMEGIMDTAKHAAMVQKFGGGTGFALSKIRPKGAPISTTHGKACGPVAVLRHLSSVSKLVTQGGKRDGANMAVMDVRHPDILEFITCKRKEGEIHNFNISVAVDTDFMERVERGEDYDLIDPRTGQVVGRLNAREVFEEIVKGAWLNGEPGMLFMDRINQDNATPHLGKIMATNPCGEQPLLPYESCNLGSLNLVKFLRYTPQDAEVDWERLRSAVRLAVRFLDNVIDANHYAIPEIERMTKLTRKIGLGVMGWADMLIRLGIPYDSEEGLAMARRVMGFIRREADQMSAELAQQRGAFPAFKGSIHDKPGAPPLRNAWRLTVAPTGTISMIAGCSSGIEPIFALVFRKQNILGGQTLYYIDQAFEAVARAEGFYSDALMEHLAQGKSLQERTDVPSWVRRLFVTAPDISPEWHVRMQAAFQESVDAGISKTINFPNHATVEDVRKAYLLAWKLGCKGITVYRAGSRVEEVLTAGTEAKPQPQAGAQPYLQPRERPPIVMGRTERIRTGHGNMYVTINTDEAGKPFEVFVALGKAGGCDSAQLEAIARLVSLALRSGVDPQAIVEQLRGITCCPSWDGGVLVKSAPDALALALGRAIGLEPPRPTAIQPPLLPKNGEKRAVAGYWGVCKKCNGPLVYQEGCLTCRECGYSECG
ncbi:Vitamin B12-dependent ribonucleoside-diphosphate reductase [bacterium HR23]|nr:Vitamin B12-dependent ribonucleoside-diphosphate reductase [bacterium HR23]